jgi:hypothetical protein
MLILKILETLSHNTLADNIGFSMAALSIAVVLLVLLQL